LPRWIFRFDQRNSLGASPRLDSLFASDGVTNLVEYLVINQAVDVVSFREPVDFSAFVLQGTPIDAICNSRVPG
jgi:hypothetical protein